MGCIIKKIYPTKILYILFVLFCLYLPIAVVVAYSFNVSKTGSVWAGFTTDWYVQMAHDQSLTTALSVSLIVALFSSAIAIAVGTVGAVAVQHVHKKLARVIHTITYIPIVIPEIVLAVSLLIFFSFLHVTYGMVTLILAHATFCIPYVFIMVTLRLSQIDPILYEAASDLGATPRQVFATITLPMILPSIVSGALLAIAMSLDDVVMSVFLAGPKSTTLPVKIYSLLKLGVTPKINAVFTIILLVTFAIVFTTQFLNKKESI